MVSFLTLPAELRNRIYKMVLVHNKPLALGGADLISLVSHKVACLTRKRLALLEVSKQLRAEVLPIIFGKNTLSICLKPVAVNPQRLRGPFMAWTPGLELTLGDVAWAAALQQLPEQAIANIRRFEIRFATRSGMETFVLGAWKYEPRGKDETFFAMADGRYSVEPKYAVDLQSETVELVRPPFQRRYNDRGIWFADEESYFHDPRPAWLMWL